MDAAAPGVPGLMSGGPVGAAELGDHLARLVWESFSDFVTDPEVLELLGSLRVTSDEGMPRERAAEELLILHLWAHTRAAQLSFHGRAAGSRVRAVLDALHEAVFEDMAANGTPEHQLPVFEQRVAARYSEYNEAADRGDERVGRAALAHLTAGAASTPAAVRARGSAALSERAVVLVNPLRDFLDDLELTDP